jgi:hypothetical protein
MATDIEEAVAGITAFYRRYHSLRFVGPKTVIRMHSALSAPALARLRHDFSDLTTPGGEMLAAGALPEERDEPEIKELPRLVVDFNKQDFARLRQLIDAVNACD